MTHRTAPDLLTLDLQKYEPVADPIADWAKARTWTKESEAQRTLFEDWVAHCAAEGREPGTCRAFAHRLLGCVDPRLIPYRGPAGRVTYRVYRLRKES